MTRNSFILACLLPVLSSCSLLRTSDPVSFLLPETDWSCGWEISWLDREGAVRRCYVSEVSVQLVDIARERPVVVTARPLPSFEVSGDFRFHPSGYVAGSPPDSGSEPKLTWFDGFAAEQLLVLAEAGVNPAMVNVDRFRDGARDRGDENPWYFDIAYLRADLIAGDLWIYSFRTLDMLPVQLPLPVGEWLTSYIPGSAIVSDSTGWDGFLPAGTHRLIRPVDGAVAVVTVDGDGRVSLMRL